MAEPSVDSLAHVLPRTPFAGSDLVAVGLSRPELRRLVRARLVRRVLVNAYVRSDVPDSIELRAQCLALVCGPHAVVVDRTAAWLWGIDLREDWSSGESITRLATYDAGLPPPVPQLWVVHEGRRLYRLDLAYPAEKVCIEYDVEQYHSSEVQRRHDAVRRAWLRRHGWTVVVVTKDSFRGAALDGWLSQVRRALYAAA